MKTYIHVALVLLPIFILLIIMKVYSQKVDRVTECVSNCFINFTIESVDYCLKDCDESE